MFSTDGTLISLSAASHFGSHLYTSDKAIFEEENYTFVSHTRTHTHITNTNLLVHVFHLQFQMCNVLCILWYKLFCHPNEGMSRCLLCCCCVSVHVCVYVFWVGDNEINLLLLLLACTLHFALKLKVALQMLHVQQKTTLEL